MSTLTSWVESELCRIELQILAGHLLNSSTTSQKAIPNYEPTM